VKDLNIKLKYRTFDDDIVKDFYVPVLSKSKYYYRAVGYFSSNILMDYVRGLIPFIKNNGKIKLIISPYITEKDLIELKETYNSKNGYSKIDEIFETFLLGEPPIFAASKLFVMLIQKNILEVKVAEPLNLHGTFHEKVGIFIGENNYSIAINGSNNETGNAIKFNQESFNTFCSWKSGQKEYVEGHLKDFNNCWEGKDKNISLKSIEEAVKNNILEKFYTEESFEELISIIKEKEEKVYNLNFKPYKHQLEATEKWLDRKNGILKFATGSGKTKTAIMIIERLKEKFKKMFFVIAVPDKTLVNQWSEEIETYEDNKLIRCSSSYAWESDLRNIIDIYDLYDERYQFLIVTKDTYFGNKFQKYIKKIGIKYLLIVDECHTWGTDRILNNLPNPEMLLGLSATPEVFYSEEKTNRLLSFFGGILHEYSLKDAINDNRLVNYYYYPIIVYLSDDEKDLYDELTLKIVKMIGGDVEDVSAEYGKAAEMLLFKRARIIYGARNKLTKLSEMLNNLEDKARLLIYCGSTSYTHDYDGEVLEDSLSQLQEVNLLLEKRNMKFAQYTSKENEYERKFAVEQFKNDTFSTLVAIKCLDEGVNIPQIERAVILASSTNPREFIQRRGRILRKYPGKEYAEIYDFIVYDEDYPSLIKKEIERLYEFASIAINCDKVIDKFKEQIDKYVLKGDE